MSDTEPKKPADAFETRATEAVAPLPVTPTLDDGNEPAVVKRTKTRVLQADEEIDVEVEEPRFPDVGDTVGNYVLEKKLGEGAHGSVFLAHRAELAEQRVALKIIPCTKERLGLVRQELVTLATVVHPNIVQLSDHGVADNYAWFTMPFYDGIPLDSRLNELFAKGEALSVEQAYEIFAPLAGALAALHAAGFRHQDIKPENIFLARFADKEHPILLDLGVAISKDNQKFLAGTREYFSPEQLGAFLHGLRIKRLEGPANLSEKMDVYGLAATLLVALVGPKHAPGARMLAPEMADLSLEEAWPLVAEAQAEREKAPIAAKALRDVRGGARQKLALAFKRWFTRDPKARPSAAEMATGLKVLLARREQAEARRRALTRALFGTLALVVLGAPAGIFFAKLQLDKVTLQQCETKVADDARSSGLVKNDLAGCQSQAQALIRDDGECKASLDKANADAKALQAQLGAKLSSCSDADRQLQALLTTCSTDRDTAQAKAKDCSASLGTCQSSLAKTSADDTKCQGDLAKSNSDGVRCTRDLDKCDVDETKCTNDLAKATSDGAKCSGDLTKCSGDLTKCNATQAKCAADLTTCQAQSTTCPGQLTTCQGSLQTCQLGLLNCRKKGF
jgi:hypothetical protein